MATTTKTQAKKSASGATAKPAPGNTAASPKSKTLEDLLEDGLNDIYSAETQLVQALPKMAKAAENEDLREAFTYHLEQTKKHVARLEKIFSELGISQNDETCEAMQGLIKEGEEIIGEYEQSAVRDSALIIAAQKVEHYEIASYGSLCELADVLGLENIHDMLDSTLEEEENTDQHLTEIAMHVNDDAYEMSKAAEANEEN